MTLTFTIMGCGGSAGTPAIGNHWGNCDPNEPKNRRTRASALVQSATTNLVIDTGTDFRSQLNSLNVSDIEHVLYTHAHGDHIHGIDELRVIRNRTGKYVKIHSNRATIDELEERFAYMFIEQQNGLYTKVLESHIIQNDDFGTKMAINDIEFTPFEQDHGTCKTLGFRFGDLAYSTDMIRLDEAALEAVKGIKTWVVDAAGYKMPVNYVHATLKQVYAMNEIIGAETVYLTHLSPAMDYQTLLKETADGYFPAYDGLSIEIGS